MLYQREDEEETNSCSQNHRSSLQLSTSEGGSICLICFTNLITNPRSPSLHISYALSQLSEAISQPAFIQTLRTFHSHLLISPLTEVLGDFDDEQISRQTIELISKLCGDDSLVHDFVARISERFCLGSLAWNRRQLYPLHCLGVLLNSDIDDPAANIKDKRALISSLINGLQYSSEEVLGEIFFVLYKLSIIEDHFHDGVNNFLHFSAKLLYLSLEALMKTQSDEVRTNCVALLTVFAQRGYFESSFSHEQTRRNIREADNFTQAAEFPSMINLFTEAIKGPMLSSSTEVQIGTLDLIFYFLSWEGSTDKHIQVLVEESVADYVFEILRLSGSHDPLVVSCIRVLWLLSAAEETFSQRLAIGFSTLVSVLHYVTEIPFHPVQSHTLKLIWRCTSNCPGIVSRSQVEELAQVLTTMFKRHTSGEMDILPETFSLACSIFVVVMQSPSFRGISSVLTLVQEAARNSVLSCLCAPQKHPNQHLLYSLYLLKEAHSYSREENSHTNSDNEALQACIVEVCQIHLLPWLQRVIHDMEEEENILGVLETFHSVLLQGSDAQARKFVEILASSSWFTLSFGCLGLFPTEKMKVRVYLMLSSIVDSLMGQESGQPVRDAAHYLPSDPLDLLFLLGQKSTRDLNLISCQSAVLLILHTSSLYDERIAEEKLVLAALEQYILVNSGNYLSGAAESTTWMQLVHLYGLSRGIAKMSYQIPYSSEAEKLLFHLIVEKEWDILSGKIHPVALKWLFQQEKISRPLSIQILNLCRLNSASGALTVVHGDNSHMMDVKAFASLIAAGDNFGATLVVSLLKQLQEEEGQEEDILSVVNLMVVILDMFPSTSDQLCLHGISIALCDLYHYSSYSSSPQIFMTCLILIFNILRSAQAETLFDNEAWLSVTVKLLEVSVPAMAPGTSHEGLLVIGILSLVLHHSTNQVLTEASKAILLNKSLSSMINSIIQAACSKGPALIDHDEETNTGETLIFVLILYYFSLRSLRALLPRALDWQNFFEPSGETTPLSVICIRCDDLCRLIHFGSSPVRLIASNCLLKLLNGISDQRNGELDELNCSVSYIKSVIAVLEGLVFDTDSQVAINCGLCLSIILCWEKAGAHETRIIGDGKWCRLVVEELALSLAAPSLASKSFTNQHKAATHVAVALLKQHQVPAWMRSVFDDPCISGIVKNLSASNVSAEMARLFRELLVSDYLLAEQIESLNRVFQACRKHVYRDKSEVGNKEEVLDKVISIPDNLDNVCRSLIRLMSSDPLPCIDSNGVQTNNMTLQEEIEMFFQESSKRG